MSYIQAFKLPEPDVAIGDSDERILDRNLDNEVLSFVGDLIFAIDNLDDSEVLVIRKVIY